MTITIKIRLGNVHNVENGCVWYIDGVIPTITMIIIIKCDP